MKEIFVLSKTWAKQFRSEKPWAAISISTEVGDFPILNDANRVELLQLQFWDIANPRLFAEAALAGKIFRMDQARQVLEFAARVWPKIEVLMVHCEMGLRRSPAMAAALTHIYEGPGTEEKYFHNFQPNEHVYQMILSMHYGKPFFITMKPKPEEVLDEPWDPTT